MRTAVTKDRRLPLENIVETAPRGIVNVAQVRKLSPFRYPGGKTWLVPRIRQWLLSMPSLPREFIEPFAGGAIVGLSVAFERLAEHVTLVELDEDVASVWQVIINGNVNWLVEQIRTFVVTHENVAQIQARASRSLYDRALATLVRNRVNRGGILAPGAGVVRLGENGRGLSSRWYASTICRRILAIAASRDRIKFVHGDGLAYMEENAGLRGAAFFIDPPYTVAARRLYRHSDLDHARLFAITKSLKGDFLMTYDRTNEIETLAEEHGFDTREVEMKTTHHLHKRELLIGRDLSWFDV